MVGLGGLEPPASSLSGMRSNQAELQAPFGNYESEITNINTTAMIPNYQSVIEHYRRKGREESLLRL